MINKTILRKITAFLVVSAMTAGLWLTVGAEDEITSESKFFADDNGDAFYTHNGEIYELDFSISDYFTDNSGNPVDVRFITDDENFTDMQFDENEGKNIFFIDEDYNIKEIQFLVNDDGAITFTDDDGPVNMRYDHGSVQRLTDGNGTLCYINNGETYVEYLTFSVPPEPFDGQPPTHPVTSATDAQKFTIIPYIFIFGLLMVITGVALIRKKKSDV